LNPKISLPILLVLGALVAVKLPSNYYYPAIFFALTLTFHINRKDIPFLKKVFVKIFLKSLVNLFIQVFYTHADNIASLFQLFTLFNLKKCLLIFLSFNSAEKAKVLRIYFLFLFSPCEFCLL
jgi:hypothetical protein